MGERRCPHCGHSLPQGAVTCTCGFELAIHDSQEPAPGIVRSAARHGTSANPNNALLMGCPSCGARISKRAHRCPKCGAAPYGQCQICAVEIVSNATSCPECGDPDPFGSA